VVLNAAFHKVHDDLPRQGVGADWCTREAIHRLPPLRKPPAIIDLGCGPGRHTIVLANYFHSLVNAVDNVPGYLDQMMEAAKAAGVEELIKPRCEDFSKLPDPAGTYDLIWSEGAAWILGMAKSLELWTPLLRARGVIVVSDLTWLSPNPPAEIKAFWDKVYPSMTDLAGHIGIAHAAGLKVFDYFALPRSAWWDEYYAPLSQRTAALRDEAAKDPALAEVVANVQTEISMIERFGDRFAYVFYLMRLS
jgi:serine/threonine-protein kinase HipA